MERWIGLREREGLSWSELSRRSGIPESTLGNWALRRRRRAADESKGKGFVQVLAGEAAIDGGCTDVVTLRSPSGATIELRGRCAERFAARVAERHASWC